MALIGAVARWLTFAGIIASVGFVAFVSVLRRAALDDARSVEVYRRARRTGIAAALLVVPCALARLAVQVDEMRFPEDPWFGAATQLMRTSWGTTWLIQVGVALAAATAFALGTRDGRPWRMLGGLLTLLLAATPSMSSHARSENVAWWAVVSDVVHVIAAGTWIGTLFVFATTIDRRTFVDEPRSVLALLARFSPLALVSGALVVGSGVASSLVHVQSFVMLVGSTYGRLLSLKLCAVAIVLGLGWRNWRVSTPALANGDGTRMRRGMAFELACAFVVLLITAFLVTTPPPMEGMIQ